MYKRLLSLFLCLIVLVGIAVPAMADNDEVQEVPAVTEIKIFTAEEFLSFAESCRLDSFSQGLVVSLENDIDLSGISFEGIPLFSGTFEGNGHTISGLSITVDGSYQGLFRYLTAEGSVRDLTIHGDIQPTGSRSAVGAVAGSNAGSVLNCSFQGTVAGGDYVGGIVGRNTVTGVIEHCTVDGDIHGDHFVGGIAGENSGVIRACSNQSQINTTPQQNSVEISDITIDTLTSSESASTTTDIGGIAGISSGVIRECENRGDVGYKLMGYNIGGIAGTQSGYIADCENYGSIQGRKETGGIVGQMEPITQIEFSEDTLQILQGQLSTMSGLVNRASRNAQSNAGQISTQIGALQTQTSTAKEAVKTLIPDAENPQLPDADTILAAQSTLSKSISSMPGTLKKIASATQSTLSGLTRDLNAVSSQISAMGRTISGASENLGGTITDVSDLDTVDLLTGKVEGCTNYGSVLADLNVGGIAGAMAMENDLDVLEDWEQLGESSLNFQSEVRAVILNCENNGVITGKKQNVGGITGWQSLGLIKLCTSTGEIDAADADYVGGISGQSTGFIRMGSSKCEISGDAYVGGIAGSAAITTDCVSQVKLLSGREKLGAVLGWAEENGSDEEDPIAGNYYLCVEEDYGAIDGISYAGLAESRDLEAFLALEELPEIFQNVTVRFLFDDGSITEIPVPLGGQLDASQIPDIPQKDGYAGTWDGLDTAQLTDLLFDETFETVYAAYSSVIESEKTRENGLPILLLEGSFTEEAVIQVEASDDAPQLTGKDSLLESWKLSMNESGTTARLLLPDDVETETLKLFISNADGVWTETGFNQDGSYLVFRLSDGDETLTLVQTQENHTPQIVLICCAAGLVLLALFVIIAKKRSKKKKSNSEIQQ